MRDGRPAAGVPQHPGQHVDADGGPVQLADLGGVDAGAASDLQAGPLAFPEQSRKTSARSSGLRSRVLTPVLCPPRNSCSYQPAISSYAAVSAIAHPNVTVRRQTIGDVFWTFDLSFRCGRSPLSQLLADSRGGVAVGLGGRRRSAGVSPWPGR